jgi:hypothetical protein
VLFGIIVLCGLQVYESMISLVVEAGDECCMDVFWYEV